MQNAIKEYHETTDSSVNRLRTIGRAWGTPKSTLQRRLAGKVNRPCSWVWQRAILSGHVIKLTGRDVSGAVTTNCRRLGCFCCCYFFFENMPYCIAKFCNVSEKNSANRAHFHRLPRNRVLRRRWLEKYGRPAGVDDQARVCSLHFTAGDYENLQQYEEGFASRLLLKAGAVPRVFGHADVPVEAVATSQGLSDRAQRMTRRRSKQVNVAPLRLHCLSSICSFINVLPYWLHGIGISSVIEPVLFYQYWNCSQNSLRGCCDSADPSAWNVWLVAGLSNDKLLFDVLKFTFFTKTILTDSDATVIVHCVWRNYWQFS